MRSLGENTESVQAFGEHLREQREAKGFSLRQFAQMVGIAPSYRILQAESPDVHTWDECLPLRQQSSLFP